MAYDNNNSGALFKNDKKSKDRDPDYRGTICAVIGEKPVEFWVSAWVKVPKSGGAKYLSMALTPKEQAGTSISKADDFDDDIPF